jgi:replicative superfamily II helicase
MLLDLLDPFNLNEDVQMFMGCVEQGTEFYDGKSKRYVDFPITDVLQMMGRAGRPQFDQHGKAVILVHEPKKSFYKKAGVSGPW